MSSRAGAETEMGSAGGSAETCASATDTEESPLKGRLPESSS